jgi:hypothetical protein
MPPVVAPLVVSIDARPFVRAAERFFQRAELRIREGLEITADEVAEYAKLHHDYEDQTETLTRSIDSDEVGGNVQSGLHIDFISGGVRVEYAPHIEWGTENEDGTQRIRARKFMANAVQANMTKYERNMEKAMDLAIADAGF